MLETPKIVTIPAKKLVGQFVTMSLVNNKNLELFSNFMPNIKQIKKSLNNKVYEVLIYDSLNYFNQFNPNNTFEKWATVEVLDYEMIPETMKTYNLEGGLYAKFHYKGLGKDFSKMMQYILMEWLPNSKYNLDNRPHFNVLGEKTKKNDPNSEEDVFIPIKLK